MKQMPKEKKNNQGKLQNKKTDEGYDKLVDGK